MIDIQNETDTRKIPLQKVGVKGLEYPIKVLDKENEIQNTTAIVNLFVNLPHKFKGTHMSRFVSIFHKYHSDVTMQSFLSMLEDIRIHLDAQTAYGEIKFPFFMKKQAPVTKEEGFMTYTCTYEGSVSCDKKSFYISVEVPVTTLCPCSKAISEYGAHNQRGRVKVKLLYSVFFWIEDIVRLIEDSASCALYSVLKRKDEKFVTEKSYSNPRFVEDVVREVYTSLKNFKIEKPFSWFSVEAENFESIHAHNAYAYTEFGK